MTLEKIDDYDRLMREFGTSPLAPLLPRFGSLHKYLRRGLFFAHRDFDKILDLHDRGEPFAVVSGRGPSNDMHIGHLIPFQMALWLQQSMGAMVDLPLSDDEKYVFGRVDSLEEASRLAYDNALDLLALGFDPRRTRIYISTRMPRVQREAIRLSRHLTYNLVKAAFGFTDSDNPGVIFYSSIQAVHILLPTLDQGLPVVVVIGIDQDPYIRVSRDIAGKLRLFKPATIENKYIRGITGEPMSASNPKTCIFLTDPPDVVKRKVWAGLTGGWKATKDQRKYGGHPERCVIHQWLDVFIIDDDKELEELTHRCRTGELLCGECKTRLTDGLNRFLKEHRKRRKEAAKNISRFFLHDITPPPTND